MGSLLSSQSPVNILSDCLCASQSDSLKVKSLLNVFSTTRPTYTVNAADPFNLYTLLQWEIQAILFSRIQYKYRKKNQKKSEHIVVKKRHNLLMNTLKFLLKYYSTNLSKISHTIKQSPL